MLKVIHRGYVLTPQQLDVLNPIIVQEMNRTRGTVKAKLEAQFDQALEEAGCPLSDATNEKA